jgi:hypothetical protein
MQYRNVPEETPLISIYADRHHHLQFGHWLKEDQEQIDALRRYV